MDFRKDINGLRAIAVIAVVLFHFNASWISGGFAGVDVFFVISGFLMTGIIFKGLQNESFSIFKFYIARANRIVPALAVLCLVLLIFGWFYLPPLDYRALGKHVGSSLGFVSNFIYWLEAGYFDAASQEKWLLHTWSLSVEWQFYIIYPLILVLMQKLTSLNTLKLILLVTTIFLFFFSIVVTCQWPNQAYYLLPTRAWEMMVGGIAFLYPVTLKERSKKYVEWGGIFLITFSYFLISKSAPWPGYLAIFPVLGAFFIIQAKRENSFVTSNIVFQKLGKWSYSIYLWHWPIVAAIYYYSLSSLFVYLGIILSVFLGFVSYRYIEVIKFKKEFSSVFAYTQCKPLYFLFVTGLLGAVVFISNGVNKPIRSMSASSETLYMTEYYRENYIKNFMKLFSEECNFFDTAARQPKVDIAASCINKNQGGIFIWGDSHAQSLSYGIRKVFVEHNISQITTSTCRPLIKEDVGLESTYKVACDRANDKAKKELLNIKPKVILLVQHIDHDKNQYKEILAYVKEHNLETQIVLIGPVPQWEPSLPNTIAKRHFDPSKVIINDRSFVSPLFRINDQLHKNYDGSEIKYISLLDELCDENGCLAKVDSKNTPLVFDYGHLSVEGSLYIAEHIIRDKLTGYLQ